MDLLVLVYLYLSIFPLSTSPLLSLSHVCVRMYLPDVNRVVVIALGVMGRNDQQVLKNMAVNRQKVC